ncbi:MAG: nuclear transport factor 2 family protein [Myxococcota bacterium]
MVRRFLPHVGVVIGLMLAVYALFFSRDAEDEVRDHLERLEAAVDVAPGTQVVLRAARVKQEFRELFTADVTFDVPELDGADAEGRKGLIALAAAAPRRFERARLELDGLDIELSGDERSAIAVGEAIIVGAGYGEPVRRDRRTVSLQLERGDDGWRIVSLSASAPTR